MNDFHDSTNQCISKNQTNNDMSAIKHFRMLWLCFPCYHHIFNSKVDALYVKFTKHQLHGIEKRITGGNIEYDHFSIMLSIENEIRCLIPFHFPIGTPQQ